MIYAAYLINGFALGLECNTTVLNYMFSIKLDFAYSKKMEPISVNRT